MSDSIERNDPLKITIPCPSYIPQGNGVYSTHQKRASNLRLRTTDIEYDMMKAEAKRLGLSLAMFVRWCGVMTAVALRQYRESGSKTEEVEIPNDAYVRPIAARSDSEVP